MIWGYHYFWKHPYKRFHFGQEFESVIILLPSECDLSKHTQKRFTSIIFRSYEGVAFLDWCPPGRSSQSHLGNGSFCNFEWQRFEKGLEICRVISFETKKMCGNYGMRIKFCYSLHADYLIYRFFKVPPWNLTWIPNAKGDTFSRPSFLVSMLDFGGVVVVSFDP